MLMPGVAFDEERHRIGYGGGFTTVSWRRNPRLSRVALAFEFQVKKEVPYEAFDICPEKIDDRETGNWEGIDDIRVHWTESEKGTEPILRIMTREEKDRVLLKAAELLVREQEKILAAMKRTCRRDRSGG